MNCYNKVFYRRSTSKNVSKFVSTLIENKRKSPTNRHSLASAHLPLRKGKNGTASQYLRKAVNRAKALSASQSAVGIDVKNLNFSGDARLENLKAMILDADFNPPLRTKPKPVKPRAPMPNKLQIQKQMKPVFQPIRSSGSQLLKR